MNANKFLPVAVEGLPFICTGLLCAVTGAVGHLSLLAWLGAAWAAACVFFFRNPSRVVPDTEDAVVSPADGTVIGITDTAEPNFLNTTMRKVSIFLSVLNVHVNRTPVAGVIAGTRYTPGKFHIASRDAASTANERNALWLKGRSGEDVVMVQVAGKVARRIVSYAREGMGFERGERVGIIRFGSRVDLYLPLACTVAVKIGDKVKGGSSVIAHLGAMS